MTRHRLISITVLLLSLAGCGKPHTMPPLAIPAYPAQIHPRDEVSFYAEYDRTVTHTSFSTTDSPEAVLAWYRAALAAGGWQGVSEKKEDIITTIAYSDGSECSDTHLSVTVWPIPGGETKVVVDSRYTHDCDP